MNGKQYLRVVKYYIIAGEASGDLHGSNLIKEIKALKPKAEFRAWGGDKMEVEGARLVKHYRDLAFMGFIEVVMNLRTILKNIAFCKEDILSWKPDVIILIDYPGFNLRIAEFAKENNIEVVYYISPQIWAWKENRIHKIKKNVDHMYVILPFEKEFYKKHEFDVTYLGHPLLDEINLSDISDLPKLTFIEENKLENKPIIAILPGSRKQEIKRMLKVMLSIKKDFPNYQFVIAGAPNMPIDFYESIVGKTTAILQNKTRELYLNSAAGLVTSGTATLEAAVYNLPEVVCYKASNISYQIAKRLIRVKYISLVNLIMDREIVAELIQGDLNKKNLKVELDRLLRNEEHRKKLFQDYKELRDVLGNKGASSRIASHLLKSIRSRQ